MRWIVATTQEILDGLSVEFFVTIRRDGDHSVIVWVAGKSEVLPQELMRTTWDKVRELIPKPEQIQLMVEKEKITKLVFFNDETGAWSVKLIHH